jgi:hypothetical protein
VAGAVLVRSAPAWSAPPTLTHLFPAGGQRGEKVKVRCTGNFNWPAKVFAPGLDVVVAKESGEIEVAIPKDLAVDRAWIRFFNDEGVSAAMPFLIDTLKEIEEKEPNDAPRTAQALADASVVVNGVLAKAGDVDCFRIRLEVGQRLVAIVDANNRLGSPMDAILQITTPEGYVVAENNDDVHLDPRLTFKASRAGDYIVRVFAFSSEPNASIQFSGGPSFVYRLTLTTGPYLTHSLPLSAAAEKPGDIEAAGINIAPKTNLPVVPFGGGKDATYHEREDLGLLRLPADSRFGLVFAPNLAGNSRVRLTPFPVISAIGQTVTTKPIPLPLPCCVTGRLETPKQVDAFALELKKGQTLLVSAETNSLGFPFDPALKLVGPDDATIASAADVGPNREAFLNHTIAKDGRYRIEIRDRYRGGGERHVYRLTVRLDEPDFSLTSSSDSVAITTDKGAELAVKVERRGTIGPITIQAVGLPDGVSCPSITSEPTGPTASTVKLQFTSTGSSFSGPIRIVGVAAQPVKLERITQTGPRLGAVFDYVWLTAPAKK